MRVLLSTIGSRGDVQPLVALALQLRALGHEAHLCVPPDFREWIEGFGIPVTPVGPEVRHAGAARPSASAPPSPEQIRQLMDTTVGGQFEAIGSAAGGCDVIVAATALQFAAASVAEKMAIPYVFAAYSPSVLPSAHHAPPPLPPMPGHPSPPPTADNRELWAVSAARTNALFASAINSNRASIGLGPVSDVRSYMFTGRPWLAADPTLAPWPDPNDRTVFQPGAWILADDRPLSTELEAFLDAGEAPIYFGFGSLHAPQGLANVMMRSARALGRRAIVSRGWADLSLDEHAADCLVIGEANLQMLFTRVAAVVHHGGAGTTTIAALAGAPQVVVPHVYDQHYFATRVQLLGIGTAHAAGTLTAESLTEALRRTLDAGVGVRARSIAGAIGRDGTHAAAVRLISGEVG